VTPDQYCREIESHLTRKNDGHLIRIVGPAFELVRGWAEQGIPFKVAAHGIDQAYERYHAKGLKRRPMRIEYAEADVLDAFDRWRRAVGVGRADAEQAPARRREGLATHISRAMNRLAELRGGSHAGLAMADDVLADVLSHLGTLAAAAAHARGEARERVIADLRALDQRLLDAARAAAGDAVLAEVDAEAGDELQPFRDRMPPEAFRQARSAAHARLLRELARLPALAPE
jgi:hypothetical protein